MGIEATYRALSPAELSKLQAGDDVWAESFLYRDLDSAEGMLARKEAELAGGRRLELGKDWHVLNYLITGEPATDFRDTGRPVDHVILGGRSIAVESTYGPMRVLDGARLQEVVEALRSVSTDELCERIDARAFREHRIYPDPRPSGWTREAIEAVVRHYYPLLVDFLGRAQEQGQAVIVALE